MVKDEVGWECSTHRTYEVFIALQKLDGVLIGTENFEDLEVDGM